MTVLYMESLEKLKQRLINLEIEQKRQDREVNKLSDLDEEIRRFEEILANLQDSAQTEKRASSMSLTGRTDLDEIDRLEKELANLDETQEAETEQHEKDTDEYAGMDDNERRYFEEIKQLKSGKVVRPQQKLPTQREIRPVTAFSKSHVDKDVKAELEKLDNYVVTNEEELRYLEEIKKLKADLGLANTQSQAEAIKKTSTPQKKKTIQADKQHGYVICLMFDPNSPNEWSEESGGGWRERGGGTCYQDLEQVKQCLRKIRKQWPNYPLRVIKK